MLDKCFRELYSCTQTYTHTHTHILRYIIKSIAYDWKKSIKFALQIFFQHNLLLSSALNLIPLN